MWEKLYWYKNQCCQIEKINDSYFLVYICPDGRVEIPLNLIGDVDFVRKLLKIVYETGRSSMRSDIRKLLGY